LAGDGYTTCDGDCDDSDTPEGFNTHPDAQEICANGRNDNCDSQNKVNRWAWDVFLVTQ
jgi:hypothetical protein